MIPKNVVEMKIDQKNKMALYRGDREPGNNIQLTILLIREWCFFKLYIPYISIISCFVLPSIPNFLPAFVKAASAFSR